MKKKILSLVLVVAMLASMLVFAPSAGAAAAGTKAEITVGKVTATAGGTVDVDIVVTSTEPVFGFNFAIDYDKSKLTLLDGAAAATFDEGGLGEANSIGGGNAPYASTSPYRFITWTGNDVENPKNATSGWVAVTLHFTVAADAIGDARIAVCDTPANYVTRSYVADDNQLVETLTYVPGGVTVLPAGYLAGEVVAESEWAFEDGYIYGVGNALAAVTGTVVVPSEIGGVAVEGIDYGAFDGCALSCVIIPAAISFIGGGAFNDCVNLTSVYVLNATTEFDVHAVGYVGGTMGRKDYNGDGVRSSTDVMIYGVAGSTAETYAADNNCSFSTNLPAYSLSVNGNTYMVSSEIAVPGVSTTADGKVVVGWSDGAKTYAPGAAMTLTGDAELTAVTIDAIEMNTGIQFKMGTSIKDCKMRYTTDMKIADYNKLAELGTVTLGTIITPAKYVSLAGGLTKEALTQLAIDNAAKLGALPDGKTGAGLTYIDVPASAANPYKETTDTYTFAGSLAGFKNENVNTKNVVYAAAFYATVTIDEKTSFTIYSNFDFGANRSVGDAITAMTGAGVEGQLTITEAATLKSWIAGN